MDLQDGSAGLVKNLEEEGADIPERFYHPQMISGAGVFLDAFWELSTDRQMGFGAGPIPHTSIVTYAERFGYDGEDMTLLLRLIRACDSVYLSRANASAEDKKKRQSISTRPLSSMFDAAFGEGPG